MVERACHAKINLALAVGAPIAPGRANEGLHPICSWMCCVGLADTLSIERANRTTYRRAFADGSAAYWPDDDDLAVRAHRALESQLGRALPIELNLVKSIPPGSGLGGGSSDAAGTLLALRVLFGLEIPTEELRRIGASLGSDIPFFVDGGPVPAPAVVAGVGEQVERVGRVDARVLLVLPPFGCATGAVYRAFDDGPEPVAFEADSNLVRAAARLHDLSGLGNDLLAAAQMVRPELGELRLRIEQATGEKVHLSGSGSTLFLLNPTSDAAAVERIAPECRIVSTRAL